MKFLVVDDDPIILSLLAEILIGFGYEDVKKARSGHEALRIVAQQEMPFDCLMLDIQMPEMDGIELCGLIRSMPQYKTIPIIMITVMRDFDHVIRAFSAGATDYTVKPFEVRELIERIRIAEIVKDPEQARQLALTRTHGHQYPGPTKNLLSRVALESFVRNCRTHRLISPVALAVRITPLEDAVVLDVASAIVSMFQSDGIFLTYLGDGKFLIVCDRFAKVPEDTLALRLAEASRGVAGVGSKLDFKVGSWFGPRRFEKNNDTAFLTRAILDCREGWWKRKRTITPLAARLGSIR